jgi:phenylalanyl-tRNA synthetase beta chain
MKASVKWLREFVSFSLTPADLAHSLTMAGLEVENIEETKDDAILEIAVTPNRPDCLSIIGIAREISVILDLEHKYTPVFIRQEKGKGPSIEIRDHHLCPRYASRIIYDVKVKPSPDWILERLESHGVRPVNNIVDITNYVLIEMGHPLHAFDLDALSGKCIVIKTADSQDVFLTLDNEKRTLHKDMLMIWDTEKPVAVAGVMGGLITEVTDSTKNVLLESAQFAPQSIRNTARYLNLVTEASYRFERGTDIDNIVPALDRAAKLIVEHAGGRITPLTDSYPAPQKPRRITVTLERINTILGVSPEPSRIQRMLTRLGIENTMEGKSLTVIPPSFRQDIHMDVDVIEELARLYGYENIPTTLPKIEMQSTDENKQWLLIKKTKDVMIRSGYSEAINYSFLNPADLDRLKLSAEDERRKLLYIRNPLKKEDETLRTMLIPALLENARINISRGEKSLRLFELSSVFFASNRNLPEEVLKLSALSLDNLSTSLWQKNLDSFYDTKGTIENLFHEFRQKDYSFTKDNSFNEPYLHPGKSAHINIKGKLIGCIGTIHPDVAEAFEVSPEITLFELNLEHIFSSVPTEKIFSPLPRYPYVERDISLIVDEDISVSDAEKVISGLHVKFIETFKLFDVYTGKPIPKGKKSLAFSLRYRAGDRTLTDEEVNKIHADIIKRLEDTLKAQLRK